MHSLRSKTPSQHQQLYRDHSGHRSAPLQAVTKGTLHRRKLVHLATGLLIAGRSRPAKADLQLQELAAGTGTHPAQRGDLVLLHYVGTLADGTVFDSTPGGLEFALHLENKEVDNIDEAQTYRDAGPGLLRPVVIRVGGDAVPGVCQGLTQGIIGMTIGSRRRITVPPEEGFGSRAVGAPYAVVPPDSTLTYDIELLRLSNMGPDALTQGIRFCGGGGAAQQSSGCQTIEPAEFLFRKPVARS